MQRYMHFMYSKILAKYQDKLLNYRIPEDFHILSHIINPSRENSSDPECMLVYWDICSIWSSQHKDLFWAKPWNKHFLLKNYEAAQICGLNKRKLADIFRGAPKLARKVLLGGQRDWGGTMIHQEESESQKSLNWWS